MRSIDPIFVAPRFVQRDWGRRDLGDWCRAYPRSANPIAEVWLQDAANSTDQGPIGRRLAADVEGMLGDLGRAPPTMRLVFPGEPAAVPSTSPMSLWTILEPGEAEICGDGHRTGERIRAYEGAAVTLAAGSVALEVSAPFQPSNEPTGSPALVRLPPVSRRMRATLFRDEGFSTEVWTLPAWSRIAPDGETCHVVTALTQGVFVDSKRLPQGAALFVPAEGRPLELTGAGAKLLVAYPDIVPTAVWHLARSPDPAGGRLPLPQPGYSPVAAILRRDLADLAA